MLAETIRQVKKSKVDYTVLAVPKRDAILYSITQTERCGWYAYDDDDENNLISRYYNAACAYGADPIVRITSDCPLILPEVINLVVREHFIYGCKYTYNRCDDSENNWPDGLDVEVFTFNLLQKAYVLAEEREHMTWLRNHGPVHIVKPDRDYGPCTSINTQEDYERALEILRERQNGGTHNRG